MRPSLLLSSAVLLGSHAFAWIALLPSFQGPKCRAQALGQSMRSSPALLCRPRGGGERQEPLPEGMISDRLAFSPAATAAGGVRQPHARLSILGSLKASPMVEVSPANHTGQIESFSKPPDGQGALAMPLGLGASYSRGSGKGHVTKAMLLVAVGAVAAGAGISVAKLSILGAGLRTAGEVKGLDLYWRIFLSGGVCASISHAWAVPLDVVKTRLQTDPEKYSGVADAFVKISREEGPSMLLKGLGATFIGYSIQGSLKYGLYAIFKNIVGGMMPTASIFVVWVLASMMADLFASTALCPLEATRIRLVADPSFARGTFDALQRLIQSEGAGSVFKGMPAILAKQLPYTIVQLCGFELLTRLFYSWEWTAALLANPSPWQWLVSFGSALVTGIVASLASQPGDVILSRVNKDRSSKPVLTQMTDAVKELGIRGLFCGTKARLLHVGTIVTIQLVIYDLVKQACGLPATGAH